MDKKKAKNIANNFKVSLNFAVNANFDQMLTLVGRIYETPRRLKKMPAILFPKLITLE